MYPKTYSKKVLLAKKAADTLLKKANSYYHKLLKRDSKPGEADEDYELLKLHTEDLSNTLLVCYLVKAENFIEAHNLWYNLDTDPRDLFPDKLTTLLDELSEIQEEVQEDLEKEQKKTKKLN